MKPTPTKGDTKGTLSKRLRIGSEDIWGIDPQGDDRLRLGHRIGNDDERIPASKLGDGAASNGLFLQIAGGIPVWGAAPGGGMGSSTWLGLTDTPATWGEIGQYPSINAAQDALEWATQTSYYLDRDGAPPTPPPTSWGHRGRQRRQGVPDHHGPRDPHSAPRRGRRWTSRSGSPTASGEAWTQTPPPAPRTTGISTTTPPHNSFVQRRNNLWQQTHWNYAWQYVAGVDTDIDFRIEHLSRGVPQRTDLARAAMDANATAVMRYMDGATPEANMRAYWLDTRRDTLVEVSDYTATSTTH